ncbi:M67 family metallopeptidase [Tumidithrix elongata RA019]|uniref:M67 family metallopeptidase n=1 Tax=Tumidithrix elongata BACA0141 TaxID=2716417 RepID=A0AAW9PYE0_9CYAN|nr:M67 family metallopeptidase [Tumidithrix elongata RA019]
MTLFLTPEHRLTIQNSAESAYPEECCGLLLGTIDAQDPSIKVVMEVRPMRNAWNEAVARDLQAVLPTALDAKGSQAPSKLDRFSIDPQEMLQVQKEARDRGFAIIGIYHSHPNAPAIPSEFDRGVAWQQYSYAIASVMAGQVSEIQSWVLDKKGDFQMEEIR